MIAGIFLEVFLTLLLVILGGVVTTGLLVARKVVKLGSIKSDEQIAYAEARRDLARHQQAIAEHNQSLAVLQLTTGSQEEREKLREQLVDDPDVEVVSVKKRNVRHPFERHSVVHPSNVSDADVAEAEDGKFSPA